MPAPIQLQDANPELIDKIIYLITKNIDLDAVRQDWDAAKEKAIAVATSDLSQKTAALEEMRKPRWYSTNDYKRRYSWQEEDSAKSQQLLDSVQKNVAEDVIWQSSKNHQGPLVITLDANDPAKIPLIDPVMLRPIGRDQPQQNPHGEAILAALEDRMNKIFGGYPYSDRHARLDFNIRHSYCLTPESAKNIKELREQWGSKDLKHDEASDFLYEYNLKLSHNGKVVFRHPKHQEELDREAEEAQKSHRHDLFLRDMDRTAIINDHGLSDEEFQVLLPKIANLTTIDELRTIIDPVVAEHLKTAAKGNRVMKYPEWQQVHDNQYQPLLALVQAQDQSASSMAEIRGCLNRIVTDRIAYLYPKYTEHMEFEERLRQQQQRQQQQRGQREV